MTKQPTPNVLETNNLCKNYGGIEALKNANFSMKKGETIAIVGDNGAGKSTFVKNITGVEQSTSGTVRFFGEEVNFENPFEARRAGIETVYQNLALIDFLNVTENMFLGRELTFFNFGLFSWLNKKKMKKEAKKLLSKTNVHINNLDQKLVNMSGGQRQCIAIARAAGWGEKLIIMDEPTAALGVKETSAVEQIIQGLKERQIPVLIISHNLRQVFDLADKICVFRQGKIVSIMDTKDVTEEQVVSKITGAIA
ncbi:MAG: ATP-binding cassette domain-containing protein [Gammaproteobacteria bacterium]|jgi:fructose transport system ATP-binding protein|nr:ATP-binding cassette domain-containing protein [Gammaproteobacteria bacterium]